MSVDTVSRALDQTAEDTVRVRLLIQLAKSFSLQDRISAIETVEEALALSEKLRYQQGILESTFLLAEFYKLDEQLPEAITVILNLLEKMTSEGNRSAQARCLRTLGELNRASMQFDQAITFIEDALDIYQKHNDQDGVAQCYNRLAAIHFEIQNDYYLVISYADKSIAISRAKRDSALTSNNLEILGAAYRELGKYQRALQYFEEARAVGASMQDISSITNIDINIANTYILLHDYTNALKYAHRAYDLAVESNIKVHYRLTSTLLARIYAEQKNFRMAYHYLSIGNSIWVDFLNKERDEHISRLNARYELEKKENEIIRRDYEIQQEQRRIIVLVIVASLLVVLALVFFYARLKLKNANKLLERLNRQTLLQKEEIERQAAQLAELNQTKDKVFSIIAHDLRAPLVALKGYVDLVEDGIISEDQLKEVIPMFMKNVNYISALTDNLLYWALNQMQGEKVTPEQFSLSEMLAHESNYLKKMATQKGVVLENHVAEDVFVYADKNMIMIVVRNLLTNALKFCAREDTISISTLQNGDAIEVCIEDSGVGIEPERLASLFGITAQSTRGTADERGTGLGLKLCKDFVEKNGGAIRVESEWSVGSRVYFTIPLQSTDRQYDMFAQARSES